MAMILALLLVLASPSWAQNTCSSLSVTCGGAGARCDSWDSTTLLVNHTFGGCTSPLVCAGSNWTCRAKPMVGTPCEDNLDCRYMMQTDSLYCDKSSATHACAMPAAAMAPSDGCRANGDVCTMNTQCAWGNCVSGWCQGLLAGANCSGVNWGGCAWNLFCWENMTHPENNMCAMKKATGQPAVDHSTMGWGYGCQSGFARNVSGMPTCVSYDGWWGTRTNGQQCYYEELGQALSSELCVNGYYCAMENSTCSMDKPDKANCTVNGYDCYDKERSTNAGSCHCTTSGANPTCVHADCGQAGPRSASMWAASSKCGVTPSPLWGKCPQNGEYDENWNGSCSFRVSECYPSKSYVQCAGNFEIAQWKKVLIPSGRVCGMDLSTGSMYWPSYCSSATLTQPLLVVVVGLMAMLRL